MLTVLESPTVTAQITSRDALTAGPPLPKSLACMRDNPLTNGSDGNVNCVASSRCHEFVVVFDTSPLDNIKVVGDVIVLTVPVF